MLYEKHLSLEDRNNLPLNGPSNYRVNNNKIITRAIEVNAVRQCNLSCKGCSHSSPIASKRIYELESLKRDLKNLSKYLNSEFIRIVGGEPLLYPDFNNLLKIIKESNICDKICLVTNGIYLNKITDDDLKYLDKIEISLYPLANKLIEYVKQGAEILSLKGVKVRLLEYSDFRESIVLFETNNTNLIQQVYNTCQIAHNWRCITVDNDRLYRCPQSMIESEKQSNYSDSLKISEIEDIREVLYFLENNEYLNSCSKCLGSVGKKFNHEQIKRNEWEKHLSVNIESGIDLEYAKTLSKSLKYTSDCMKRNNLN